MMSLALVGEVDVARRTAVVPRDDVVLLRSCGVDVAARHAAYLVADVDEVLEVLRRLVGLSAVVENLAAPRVGQQPGPGRVLGDAASDDLRDRPVTGKLRRSSVDAQLGADRHDELEVRA